MKLPKVIYVKREKDGDAEYLVASEHTRELAERDEAVIIGQYRLEHMSEVRMGIIAQEITKDKK